MSLRDRAIEAHAELADVMPAGAEAPVPDVVSREFALAALVAVVDAEPDSFRKMTTADDHPKRAPDDRPSYQAKVEEHRFIVRPVGTLDDFVRPGGYEVFFVQGDEQTAVPSLAALAQLL